MRDKDFTGIYEIKAFKNTKLAEKNFKGKLFWKLKEPSKNKAMFPKKFKHISFLDSKILSKLLEYVNTVNDAALKAKKAMNIAATKLTHAIKMSAKVMEAPKERTMVLSR